MPNPNMTYEELRNQLIKTLGLEEQLNGQLVPLPEDIQADWSFTVDELIQLFATLGAEVIGEDDYSMSNTLENPSWDDMRKQASLLGQNDLRYKQRIHIAQLTTKPHDN